MWMELTKKQQEMMDSNGHLLVTGGLAGSGKTTGMILKAGQIAARGLRPGQKILFSQLCPGDGVQGYRGNRR